jgi:hypothetical protein
MTLILVSLLTLLQAVSLVDQGVAAFTRQDYTQARDILRPLADGGDGRAQYYVGQMYLMGVGYARNYVQAHVWFNLSAARGVALAATARNEVEKQMTSAQRAEAERLAMEWRPVAGGQRPPGPAPSTSPITTPSRGPLAPSPAGSTPTRGEDPIDAFVDYLSDHVRAKDSRHSEAYFDVENCVLTSEVDFYVSSRTTVEVTTSMPLSRVDHARQYPEGPTIFAKSDRDVRHERSSKELGRTSRVFSMNLEDYDFNRFNELLKAAVASCSR